MENIFTLYNYFIDLTSEIDKQEDQIYKILIEMDQQLILVQNENYQMYGVYQYCIADQCLSQLNFLTESQISRYQNQFNTFKNIFEGYIQQLETTIQSGLTLEQKNEIEYQLQSYNRQRHQGANKKIGISHTIKSILNFAKNKNNFKQSTFTGFKSSLSKFNVFATLGIAALETVKVYFDYRKMLECCQTEKQKKEAQQVLKQQLHALGARTICSAGITTGVITLGAAIGSFIPVVGTVAGGLLGALVGGICSYFVEKNVIDPFFLVQNNDLTEYERQIGLEEFKSINNGQDYTKEEFDCRYKKCLLNEHPDKQTTESLKAIARQKIFKIQLAKEMIYKLRGWSQ